MRTSGLFTIVLSLFTICVLLAPAATAGGERGEQIKVKELSRKPIVITAEELVAENRKRRVIFKGNVVAKQNGLTIWADKVMADYGDDGKTVAKIIAEGNVKVVQENLREARGDRAIFINEKQTIELQGNTEVVEGESRLMGERLIIYIAENRSVIAGGEEGRVKAIINPKQFLKGEEGKKE